MRASFIQIPIELIEDQAISPLELRLYCSLMRYGMEGAGYSQAGHRFLARKLDVHPQTIARALKNLQEAGYISVEKICLNRNDKIRCLKTIKREKRSEPQRSTQNQQGCSPPLLYNIKNKRDIRLEPQNLEEIDIQNNPYIPYIPTPTDETITPLPEHQDETDEILAGIKKNVRKTSFTDWFDGKIAISYSDSKRIEVNCVGDFKKKWLKDYYSSLIERISGKKVSFVVIYRKEMV